MGYLVHGMRASGNCHKVRLALDLLREPYEWREVDLIQGETRGEAFRAMNPNGQVPVLQTPDGRFLPESNAILWYLAEGTPLVPTTRWDRAQALRWMFFEQYTHEPAIAVARFICVFLKRPDDPRLDGLQARGRAALQVMDSHLAQRAWFAGPALSVADLALFAYTHRADEGGIDLAPYPAVRTWVARCLATPGVTPMPAAT